MPFNIAMPCLIIQSYLHYLEFVRYYRPQSRSHQEKTEYFFCQSYPSTFHSHHTNQIKGSTEVQDFLLKGTYGRILASLHAWMWARTHADTHTDAHSLYIHSDSKRSPLNCDKQTRKGPRKESFKRCQVHSSHPSAPPGYPTEH